MSSCKRQFIRAILIRRVPKRVRNRMRSGLGTDRMKFGTAATFYLPSCERTATFWVSDPARLYEPAMVLVQRPTTGRILEKTTILTPQKEACKQIYTSFP